jgi:uncharacterized repeat protein (TIGR03837 family)
VRGEDSFVRAQWAGKPFVWHIYPQDKNLHHVKLRAFLQRYAIDHSAGIESLVAVSLQWNGAERESSNGLNGWPVLWSALHADISRMTKRAADWQLQMLENGDLTSNLLKFSASL